MSDGILFFPDIMSDRFWIIICNPALNIYIFSGTFLSKYLLLFKNTYLGSTTLSPQLRTPIQGQGWNRCSGCFFKEIRQIYFHTFVGNSVKIKWRSLGLLRYQKDMGNEIFSLKKYSQSSFTYNQIYVQCNEIKKMYNRISE